MPILDGSVGRNGQNKTHDVAVVQAALKWLKGPDRKPLWAGPADGSYSRHRQAMDRAIALFQQANRLQPSGRIDRNGAVVNKMELALPMSHRKMTGVPGTAVVRREFGTAPGIESLAGATERKAPLPTTERRRWRTCRRESLGISSSVLNWKRSA